MKSSAALYGLLAATLAGHTSAAGTPVIRPRASTTLTPITITGNAFYQGSERFYIRGVDYAPGGGIGTPEDPIANSAGCARDIPYFTKLNINTIRVYTIDNTANHDECMNALAEAGIYLVLDTDNAKYSLNRDDPAPSYNSIYLQSVFATVDQFAAYSNTLAFLSGNEVINNASNTNVAPYVKATTRDIKSYIVGQKHRQIPVGYSAADVSANQELMAMYMNCGTADERSDFYSINDYSWCDPSSYTTSGWNTLVASYSNYSIPLFMSEFGCITNGRSFEEIAALYNPEMTGAFSGGLVYEYSEEGNNYGLVTISGNTVTPNSQFTALEAAYKATPNPTGNGGAKTSGSPSICPAESSQWEVANNNLPAIPSSAQKFIKSGSGSGPGLNGPGSQSAGNSENDSQGTSQSTASASSSVASQTPSGKSSNSTSAASSLRLDFSVVAAVSLGLTSGMMLL